MSSHPELPDPEPDGGPSAPRPRPQPNVWWSLLACVGVVALQTPALLAVWIAVWIGLCVIDGGNVQAGIQSDNEVLQRVVASDGTGDPPPAMPPRVATALTAGVAASDLTLLVYAAVLVRWVFGRRWPRVVTLRRPGVGQLLIAWLVFLPGLMFTAEGLYALLLGLTGAAVNPNTRLALAAADAAPVWLAVLAIGVGPGVAEELFCRGFLGRGLVGRHGWVVGVLLTSALFGLLHLDPLYMVVTAVLGVGLHFTLATSRSLWVPVLLHATNNTMSVVSAKLPTVFDMSAPPLQIALRYGSAAALLALGAWALWSCRAKLVPPPDTPDGWQPRFPGVAAPPPGSGVMIEHGRPNLLPLLLAPLPLAGVVCSLVPVN